MNTSSNGAKFIACREALVTVAYKDGHTKRRIREMILGIDGYYGDLSQVAFFDGDPRRVARQFMPLPENI